MIIKTTALLATAALGLGTAGFLATGTAQADWDIERERSKGCSAGAWTSLSLEKNRRTIEADVDIERSPVGQTWRVRLAQNGTVIERTTRVADREGDVELSRRLTDQPGRDKVAVRAVSAMGEVCRVTVRI